MSLYPCERCGRLPREQVVAMATLFGEVIANLCTVCRRDWERHFHASAILPSVVEHVAHEQYYKALATAGTAPSLDQLHIFYLEKERIQKAAYTLAVAWLAAPPKA